MRIKRKDWGKKRFSKASKGKCKRERNRILETDKEVVHVSAINQRTVLFQINFESLR